MPERRSDHGSFWNAAFDPTVAKGAGFEGVLCRPWAEESGNAAPKSLMEGAPSDLEFGFDTAEQVFAPMQVLRRWGRGRLSQEIDGVLNPTKFHARNKYTVLS